MMVLAETRAGMKHAEPERSSMQDNVRRIACDRSPCLSLVFQRPPEALSLKQASKQLRNAFVITSALL